MYDKIVICKFCSEEKSLDNYYKRKFSKINHQSIYKICSYILLKIYIKNNENIIEIMLINVIK